MRSPLLAWLAALILTSLLVLHLGREVSRNYVDVPYWDEWALAPLVFDVQDGRLPVRALFAPHNGHRPAVPRAMLVALAPATSWDMWPEVLLVLGAGLATVLAAVVLARRCLARGAVLPWWSVPSVAALLLSTSQWGNWTGGWGVGMFLMLAHVIAGLAALGRPPIGPVAFAFAGACAIAASFSFANGLLLWVLAIPLLWVNGGPRRLTFLVAWTACAAAVAAFYVPGLDKTGIGSTPGLATGAYVLRFLGAPLVNSFGAVASATVGAAGLAALGITLWRVRAAPAVWPAAALAIFAMASAVLVALGRDAGGEPQVATRYLSVGNMLWLALLLAWIATPPVTKTAPLLAAVIAALAAHEGQRARPTYQLRTRTLAEARHVLFTADSDALLVRFFPAPDYLRALLPELRQRFLGPFACGDRTLAPAWRRAIATVTDRARPGDVLVASSDWAAACASYHAAGARFQITSARESAAAARAAMRAGPGRFLLVAGDVVSHGAREVMTTAHPLWVGGGGTIGVYYAPDRAAYRAERQTERELAEAARTVTSVDLVTSEAGELFLERGWSGKEHGRDGAYRWATGVESTLYVPVEKHAPRTLHVEARPLSRPGVAQVVGLRVNGTPVIDLRLGEDWTRVDVDVIGAPWVRGANALSLTHAYAIVPAEVWPRSTDERPLAVCYRGLRLSP